MPIPLLTRLAERLRALREHDLFAPTQWRRRAALWSGGILVGLAAIAFAQASDLAFAQFRRLLGVSPWLPLLVTPLVFVLMAWLTEGRLRATRGSGIPQTIAALEVEDDAFRQRLLAPGVALGKMALTVCGLLGGASIGREGPTVHVGAGIMFGIGRALGFRDPKALSRFILAGAAAGIAAAFNTPLAGVVFAVEELSGTWEDRFSGLLLTAVIFAGVVSLGILGNYSYFGTVDAALPLGRGWLAVLACGLCGGLGGGAFATVIQLSRGPLARIAALRTRRPRAFAAACGLAVAIIGVASGNAIYGTGYAQAQALLQGAQDAPAAFGLCKLGANILSYWAGIPGGIFSPALAVGSGMGHTLETLLGGGAGVVLLGMAAFLSGATQTPLTAAVISMELTHNQNLAIPIFATCLIARAVSTLLCRKPVYHALAHQLVEQHERAVAAREAGVAPAQNTYA